MLDKGRFYLVEEKMYCAALGLLIGYQRWGYNHSQEGGGRNNTKLKKKKNHVGLKTQPY